MTSSRSASLAAAVLVLLGALPSAGANDVSQSTPVLRGTVTDTQGAPLRGVRIGLTSEGGADTHVVETDLTGRFAVIGLPAGTYVVTFSAPGFTPRSIDAVEITRGSTTSLDVTLELAPFSATADVVAVAPLGGGLDRDRLPAAVHVIERDDIRAAPFESPADTLASRLGSVSLNDSTTNPLQRDVRFRGFTASPLLGLPQGLAVYQNGVRINEPFGDTVQLDLVPLFALDRVQLTAGADPVHGLNALGGALSLDLRDGFGLDGAEVDLTGGSFGRYSTTAQYGVSSGAWAAYVGATRMREDGWRDASPSTVGQVVADVAHRGERTDAGVSLVYAETDLTGNGPAPAELLAVDRDAVFTSPDTTLNQLRLFQGRIGTTIAPLITLDAVAYHRSLDRDTLNGDEADIETCAPAPGRPDGALCLDGVDPLVDLVSGRRVTSADGAGDGVMNRTRTRADGYGGSIQLGVRRPLGAIENSLILGLALDRADVAFGSGSELGTLTPGRAVVSSGIRLGVLGEAPDDELNTGLDSRSRSYGLYFSNTVSLHPRWHVTLSGRYDSVTLDLIDRLGTSLDGSHAFGRFNPSGGVVFQASEGVSLFGRYSESSRAPTAAELSCADPTEPCRVPNAFVSDPPLEQAVARAFEGGMRGRLEPPEGWGDVSWSVAAYRSRIADDLLFVASPALIGAGFFQNAGDTQRVGVEVDVEGVAHRVGWYASYAFVRATFESPIVVASSDEVNAAADEDGFLRVQPGDRLPGVPAHQLKLGLSMPITQRWSGSLEAVLASSQVFRGDEGNDQPRLPGYGIVNLRSVFEMREGLEITGAVTNLFDRRYETFGVLAELELDLTEAPDAENPVFVSPGSPVAAHLGVRVRF